MRVNKLDKQVEVLTDLIADNKKLKEKVELLELCENTISPLFTSIIWLFSNIDEGFISMDKRIYAKNTYKNHTYDWDMLMNYLADDDTHEVFDRIESINREDNEKKEVQKK